MNFEIVSEITNLETIAVGGNIDDIKRLQKRYGKGRWRKMKGVARVLIEAQFTDLAELHWYEANGIGKKEIKIKRYLS